MDPSFPTNPDAQLILQAAVTKTATFDSAALDLGSEYAPGGSGQPMVAPINVSAVVLDGNQTYTFVLQQSADGATNWAPISPNVACTGVGAPVAKGFVTQEFVRLVLTVTGSTGSTPSITYQSYLSPLV